MNVSSSYHDVVVVGAGNAAMCAAMSSLEAGATVAILEKAPEAERGGNSSLTLTMRIPSRDFAQLEPLLSHAVGAGELAALKAAYRPRHEEHLRDEMLTATHGQCDVDLLEVYLEQAYETVHWLAGKGHRWVGSIDPTSHNPLMMEGRGYGYQERNFRYVTDMGAAVHYETTAERVLQDRSGRVCGVSALSPAGRIEMRCGALVLACGGFESNPEMRARYLGAGWESVRLRGVPYNTGDGLRMAMDIGAMPHGGWSTCHASPQDWERPKFALPSGEQAAPQGGFGWSRYSYPFGILVNSAGRRFVDEANDVRGMTYARIGSLILQQPGGKAFQIFDRRARRLGLIADIYDGGTGWRADTIPKLAATLGINPDDLAATVDEYNAAVQPGESRPSSVKLDGHGTKGLAIEKSNYAAPLIEPPFEGHTVRCGITFTFGGLKIQPDTAQVQHVGGRPIPGLYAAGEMVGGLFYDNYPGGSGMTSGAVFGRVAGRAAARSAKTVAQRGTNDFDK